MMMISNETNDEVLDRCSATDEALDQYSQYREGDEFVPPRKIARQAQRMSGPDVFGSEAAFQAAVKWHCDLQRLSREDRERLQVQDLPAVIFVLSARDGIRHRHITSGFVAWKMLEEYLGHEQSEQECRWMDRSVLGAVLVVAIGAIAADGSKPRCCWEVGEAVGFLNHSRPSA